MSSSWRYNITSILSVHQNYSFSIFIMVTKKYVSGFFNISFYFVSFLSFPNLAYIWVRSSLSPFKHNGFLLLYLQKERALSFWWMCEFLALKHLLVLGKNKNDKIHLDICQAVAFSLQGYFEFSKQTSLQIIIMMKASMFLYTFLRVIW